MLYFPTQNIKWLNFFMFHFFMGQSKFFSRHDHLRCLHQICLIYKLCSFGCAYKNPINKLNVYVIDNFTQVSQYQSVFHSLFVTEPTTNDIYSTRRQVKTKSDIAHFTAKSLCTVTINMKSSFISSISSFSRYTSFSLQF